MQIILFVSLFYLLPATICWFFIRWSVKNGFETGPDMIDVFITITPIFNIIMIGGIIVDIWSRSGKSEDFPRKFFRL